MILLSGRNVQAAEFNGTVSSATATQGDTVTVTVTFTSGSAIGAYAVNLSYDANILEYVSGAYGGGGGTLQFYNDHLNSTSESYTVTFTAKTAGTSAMSLKIIDTPCDTDANDMTVKTTDGSVTVTAPAEYSSDNRLAALNVSLVYADGTTESIALTPGFSADVTSYQLSVPENVTRLSLDASAADGKAAVAVSGTALDPGSNTTTITVTAENGDTRQYSIYTEKARAQETTTQQETESQTENETENTTQQEETTEEQTTAEEVTTVAEGEDPLEVVIDGQTYRIVDIPEGVEFPEGYEAIQTDYHGVSVLVLQGLSTSLQLMYLENQETGEGDFYIYDKTNETFTPYIALTVRQHVYAILDIPEDAELPFGGTIGDEYTLIPLKIGDKTIQALNYGVEDIYLVYAVNWNGDKGFYYYDAKEGSMLRYEYSAFEQTTEQTDTQFGYDLSQAERKAYEQRIEKRNLVIIILVLVVVVLLGAMLLITVIVRKNPLDAEDEDEDASDEELYNQSEENENEEEDMENSEDDDEQPQEEPMAEEDLDQALDDILGKK
jgi:hypothetical protein